MFLPSRCILKAPCPKDPSNQRFDALKALARHVLRAPLRTFYKTISITLLRSMFLHDPLGVHPRSIIERIQRFWRSERSWRFLCGKTVTLLQDSTDYIGSSISRDVRDRHGVKPARLKPTEHIPKSADWKQAQQCCRAYVKLGRPHCGS